MTKRHISPDELLTMSYRLALHVYESGFDPDYIVGIWRGGAPIGIAVQELLKYVGVESDHVAIRTSSYVGVNQRNKQVQVHGLNYIIKRIKHTDKLLIVDDVFDTGLSVAQVVHDLTTACKLNTPQVRIATPFFKPNNNQTDIEPDYCLEYTDEWLVFPHEVCDLTKQELADNKPELYDLLELYLPLSH